MLKISDIPEENILFYDIETDHQYAPYAQLKLIGVKYGFEGKPERVKHLDQRKKFKEKLADRDTISVGFNNLNFDNIVLLRNNYTVNPDSNHDGFLMMKAIAPRLPSYSLKFVNWFYGGDPHWQEMEFEIWRQKTKSTWEEAIQLAPKHLINAYLDRDLSQHEFVFKLAWEKVQESPHWKAYQLDLSQGAPVAEMILKGGLFIDRKACREKIALMQNDRERYNQEAHLLSGGEITNVNSSKQVGAYLNTEGFALELSANGDFAVKKSDLVDLKEEDPIADLSYKVREINGTLKFFENYLAAAEAKPKDNGWIPYAIGISVARTRRFTSSSLYGINFQNANESAKAVQRVPEGWLGVWIDATQVENVVHIYESEGAERRQAYEADEDWNEYVWLCNRIKDKNKDKKYWDSVPSPEIPHWTIYKQFKTAKLALNFGMGVRKFCKITGVDSSIGYKTFNSIHEACPDIHILQNKVARLLVKYGRVQDVFGHIYSDEIKRAYKAVAYLVQGCGTGSLPKAQIAANYLTIHKFDEPSLKGGIMCGSTHDEIAMRLNLQLGPKRIQNILDELMSNMTKKFSLKFDNIPLRAKLYLSRTTAAEHEEVKISNTNRIREFSAT